MSSRRVQQEVVLSLLAGEPSWRRPDPPGAEALSLRERAMLERVDPRALRADAFRAARLAQAALERHGALAVVLLARPAGWEMALAFATSPEMEGVVRGQDDLFEAAATFLRRRLPKGDPAAALLALDRALRVAGERGRHEAPLAGGQAPADSALDVSPGHAPGRLAPWTDRLDLTVGTLAWHATLEALHAPRGNETPWEGIWRAARDADLPDPPPDGPEQGRERVLVVGAADGTATAELLGDDLDALLTVLATGGEPAAHAFLATEMSPADAREVLDDLCAGGLITRPSALRRAIGAELERSHTPTGFTPAGVSGGGHPG